MLATFDETITFYLNHFANQSIVLSRFTFFCAAVLPILFFILVAFHFCRQLFLKTRRGNKETTNEVINDLFFLAMSLVGTAICAVLFKDFFASPRPFVAFPNMIHAIFIYGANDSFPSMHAALLACVATAISIRDRRLIVPAILIALLVGAARVASGVHYPLDILAGYIIGISMTFCIYFIKVFHYREREEIRL